MIRFNKPYFSGNETKYIEDAILNKRKISGNGFYTEKCQNFFETKYGFKKCLLTTSCTDALEMCAILCDIKEGDEVIMPSYTFVSTANPFVLRGAKIVFADSSADNPNIDVNIIELLITPKTKAIVPVHYAGFSCEMKKLMQIANKHGIYVIEDAAQAIDSYFDGKPLGSFGHLAAFSFHETKNIISGEGGMLVINHEKFIERAEIIWEKGTNRASFFRGEVNKYGWVDVGSSFLPSDMIAAFLWAQLEKLDEIQKRRIDIWNIYFKELSVLEQKGLIKLPKLPKNCTNNAHMFYIICASEKVRDLLIQHLKKQDIYPVFHYLSLHSSTFFENQHDGRLLKNSDYYSDCLLRLPFYFELAENEQLIVISHVKDFYK